MRDKKFLFIAVFIACISCGTLGGFESINVPVERSVLKKAMDSLYSTFPEYQIPDKWKKFDTWRERGYGFLDGTIFYFAKGPEEMYYVTFIGDSTEQAHSKITEIAVRAVSRGSAKWILEEDTNKKEKQRVENRFRVEILSKLEKFALINAPAE